MMGYEDPNEDIWEALFWDDILKEFGPGGYVEIRYMGEEVKTDEASGLHIPDDAERAGAVPDITRTGIPA